MLGIPAGVL